jgi:hypothetical protein
MRASRLASPNPMRAIVSFLIAAVAASVSSSARADVAPPNLTPCLEKSADAACTTDDGSAGKCVPSTCSTSSPDHRGRDYACTVCSASPASTGKAASSSRTSSEEHRPSPGGCGGCALTDARAPSGAWAIAMSSALVICVARRRRRRVAEFVEARRA